MTQKRSTQLQVEGLTYSLGQPDAMHHSAFETAVRDLLARDGARDALRCGGQGDLGADVKGHDQLCMSCSSACTGVVTHRSGRRGARCRYRGGAETALIDVGAWKTRSLCVLEKLGFERDHVSTEDNGEVVWLTHSLP